ncbi:hypothetical protein BDV93DRAFT_553906 [Ceratobasidium sp. AG-I]|nr:hypothetical protein BDV93DRAFT_553906 [Ceratobasidium sp. AG-I]
MENLVLVDPPLPVVLMPVSKYGIMYDLYSHNIMDDAPSGWGMRAPVYAKLHAVFTEDGFQFAQYSAWERPNSTPGSVWATMLRFRTIEPPGLFATVSKALKMYQVTSEPLNVSDHITLGGQYSPILTGPTPRGLVPAGVPHVPVPADWRLPAGVKPTPNNMNLDNWVQHG